MRQKFIRSFPGHIILPRPGLRAAPILAAFVISSYLFHGAISSADQKINLKPVTGIDGDLIDSRMEEFAEGGLSEFNR